MQTKVDSPQKKQATPRLPEEEPNLHGAQENQLATIYEERQPELGLMALPKVLLAHIFKYLDPSTLFLFLQVNQATRQIVFMYILEVERWRTCLVQEFSIPREITNTFLLPHLVHERLSNLKKHPSDDRLHLFRKIRYAFCAPGYDPFSMPWLFYPFTANVYDQFIKQLNEDGEAFQRYYLDMACRVGNFAFVRFMLQTYNLKLNIGHLGYCCESGNLALVKYCLARHKMKPDYRAIKAAAKSGNQSLVEYVLNRVGVIRDENDLQCSILSGDTNTVNYLQGTYNFGPARRNFELSITSGNMELVRKFSTPLLPTTIEVCLQPKTITKELIQYLIDEHNFSPTQKTLGKALEGGHWELTEFLIHRLRIEQPEFVFDFKRCAITGDIDFMKRIITTYEQIPDIKWLQCAIFSGNVLLVKYLIDTYSLDPKNISFRKNTHKDLYNYPFVFCHVPMAKFLIEEHGCSPCPKNIGHYIKGENLPVARYLCVDYGLQIPDAGLDRISHQRPFYQELYHILSRQRIISERLSENPILCTLGMKESYRFEELQPYSDLSTLGKTFISAMCLFLRQRLKNYTYLEIAPPCSYKKQNTLEVLAKVKDSINQKLINTRKRTNTVLIPFSVDNEDREWHLLELNFSQTVHAKIHSTRGLPLSDETLLNRFNGLFDSVKETWGPLATTTYVQGFRFNPRPPQSSAFLVLVNILTRTVLIKKQVYNGKIRLHPQRLDQIFLSGLTSFKMRSEILGFLLVNFKEIPSLIEQGYAKTDDVKNLIWTLSKLFFENDGHTHQLITYNPPEKPKESFLLNEFNYDYSLLAILKEAFLETYEFDGYDTCTKEFKPAFPGYPNRRYKFPSQALTFWAALAIFIGIPSRPENGSRLWTWRQTIRNFFGGWSRTRYDAGNDILSLTLIPVKIGVALFKIATIPFKTALNIIKLFTEFFPAVLAKKGRYWLTKLVNLEVKKTLRARGFLLKVFAYRILCSIGYITYGLIEGVRALLRTVTSPEKSTRMAWAMWEYDTAHLILLICSLFFTVALWTSIAAAFWFLATPFITTQFPTVVSLFITVTHTPLIAPAVAFIKSTFLSLWALFPTAIGLVNFGLIVGSAFTLIIASKLSDRLSNLWIAWFPQRWNSAIKIPTEDSEVEMSKLDVQAQKEKLSFKNPEISDPGVAAVAGLQLAEEDAERNGDHASLIAARVGEASPENPIEPEIRQEAAMPPSQHEIGEQRVLQT